MVAPAESGNFWLQLSLGDTLAIIGLGVSLVGNVLQFQRTRSTRSSLYNGLVGLFNAVGWTLSYCIARETAAASSAANSTSTEVRNAFQEMGQFATAVDYQCRLLHEQIVSVAKTLKIKDARWQGQFFGMRREDVDRLTAVSQSR
jgi:hypothetical protein